MDNGELSRDFFLSICVLSYNRVDELYRGLQSIDTVYKDLVEVVISEDCSPRRDEIAKIVNRFISETEFTVVFNPNPKNLGFDCNIGKAIEIARGKYILLITDDDVFLKGSLDKTIETLQKFDCAVAFSPYFDEKKGVFERQFGKSHLIPKGIDSVKKHLYSTILVSGLIFKKNQIINYSADRFKDLIYSQVYLFASLLYRNNGYYIDSPLVGCVSDGENFFGKNESGDKNPLLAAKSSIFAGPAEYHKRLIKVIEIFDRENGTDLMSHFSKEYSLRSYSGMFRARKVGKHELSMYWDKMNALGIKLSVTARIYYVMLKALGPVICEIIFQIPRKTLFAIRKL